MCSDIAIKTTHLSKVYPLFDQPIDRLKQFFFKKRQYFKAFTALENISLELKQGEILGIIGRNGSGKSTLLQLICSTISPTSGELRVNGRIAALLELGAGFNPEFTGRENIYLNASILGLTQEEIEECYDDIVEFSGIGEFIDRPVKTYSSGMYVRLAFSVAISVKPDILVVDEALSVGDGAFSKKSFDRIMELKNAGKTILFCSHSMYQIEALCNQVIWLDQGRLKKIGEPSDVVVAYNAFLDEFESHDINNKNVLNEVESDSHSGTTRFTDICLKINGQQRQSTVISRQSELSVNVAFKTKAGSNAPSVAVSISTQTNKVIASSSTHNDNYTIKLDEQGHGKVCIVFPKLPLLKGRYYIDVFLACDQALHLFEHVSRFAEFEVIQKGLEQGYVALDHQWKEA